MPVIITSFITNLSKADRVRPVPAAASPWTADSLMMVDITHSGAGLRA